MFCRGGSSVVIRIKVFYSVVSVMSDNNIGCHSNISMSCLSLWLLSILCLRADVC